MVSLFLLLGCNLSYIVDLFAALHELASASARTLLKFASSVRALLKPYGDTLRGVFLSSQSIALYIYDVHEERVHDTTSLPILNSFHDLETSGTMNPLLETKNSLHFIRKPE